MTNDVNRRQLLSVTGAGIVLAAGGTPLAAGKPGQPGAGTEKTVTVEDATNVALTVSPDGKRIAFDLLGILWTLPVGGGSPLRLTGDFDDLGQPDWSPDGRRIAFQSYRSGNFHIWTIPADGGPLTQHTDGLNDHREPRWSPDGKTIALSSDRSDGRYAIHLLDVASGAVRLFSTGTSQDSEPAWSPDGKTIAYVADGTKLLLAPVSGGTARVAASVPASADRLHPSEIHAPGFSPDGKLGYVRIDGDGVTLVHDGKDVIAGEDLYPFRTVWLEGGAFLYGSGGKIRRRDGGKSAVIPFSVPVPVTTPRYTKKRRDFSSTRPRPVKGIVGPQLSPDGKAIVFGALNDLWLLPIGGKPRKLVSDRFYKVDPAWSPDGRWIAYSTDRAGTLDIWLREVATGTERQLTNLPNQGAVSAAWSRDGKLIAFLDQEGALHNVEVASGAVQKVYAGLWEPGRPSFGPEAKTIAYAAFKPYSARYREGLSEILTVDRATGKGRYAPVAENKSIGVRGLDGPVWSPDGTRFAYVLASTLWTVTVDETGAFTGTPQSITSEVTDAPSWSGDSGSLLYLSNGALRIVSADGGTPHTVPCALTWAYAKPTRRLVIAADRLWDGLGTGYRSGADVVVEGNRIKAVVPRGAVTDANARRIDGTSLTLLPGLVDMHTHRQMQGYNYGDRMGRLWLAFGITATRSPGAPAYHMVEDREAIDSGARIAARHYATGEAIDGGRIYYNFMRPVTEPGQLALELSRAEALSYDMIKTYVRLRHDIQREVVQAAHRLGMHLSSHYHYPALHSGMDCMEHTGATNRYGYSRTITAQGGGYQDVNGLFAAAKAGRTPTLFAASALLGEDDALARDARIRALFPPWEYAKLLARVKAMQNGGGRTQLASLKRQVAQIRQTIDLGGFVISGTDAPIDLVAISLHLNLRGMVRHGITPVEALATATRNAGDFLGEPIGRIVPDALADLILVAGDPLATIEDAADVHTVIANGVAHTPETLIAPFAGNAGAAAVHNLRRPALAGDSGHFWESAAYVESGRHACCDDHWHAPHGLA